MDYEDLCVRDYDEADCDYPLSPAEAQRMRDKWEPVIEPNRDMFWVDPEYGVVKELYFNPDANSGAQFVLNSWSFGTVVEDADESDDDYRQFFILLDCDAKQYCYDIGDEMFDEMRDLYNAGMCDAEGVGEDTMKTIVNAARYSRSRCCDCAYLYEDEQGRWVCDDCGKLCIDIPDDECSANEEW